MKQLFTLFIAVSLCIAASAQITLVNQTVLDTVSHPSHIYSSMKVLSLPGIGYDVMYDYFPIGGGQQNYAIIELDTTGTPINYMDYNGLNGGGNFGTNLARNGIYMYAVGFTTDSDFTQSTHTNITRINIGTLDTIWSISTHIDSAVTQAPVSAVVDASGSVYVGATVQTPTDYKIAIVKYASNRTRLWEYSYDTAGLNSAPIALSLDRSGLLNVTGFRFDSTGYSDFLTLSLHTSSGTLNDKNISPNGTGKVSHPVNIQQDQVDHSYVAGTSTVYGTTSVIKMVAYDSLYNQLWVTTYGDSSLTNIAAAMCTDAFNGAGQNIYITGSLIGATGEHSLVALRYTTDGTLQWAQTITAANPAYPTDGIDINTDGMGNCYLTGSMYNGTDTDIVTAAFDSLGNMLWQKIYNRGWGINDVPYNVGINSDGSIFATARSFGADSIYLVLNYTQETTTTAPDSTPPTQQWAYYENKGQLVDTGTHQASYVHFYTNTSNPRLYMTDSALSYVFEKRDSTTDSLQRVDLILQKSTMGNPDYYSSEQIAPYLNYYIGGLPSYYEDVHGYQRITAKNVYSGIDWQLYSDSAGPKYYYVVQPGADPTDITFQYIGADSTTLDTTGLTIYTRFGYMKHRPVSAYQYSGGTATAVSISYSALGSNAYAFSVGTYDNTQPLYIEMEHLHPAQAAASIGNLTWSTYWGGSGNDQATKMDIDDNGVQFMTGKTQSTNFPITPVVANTTGNIGSFLTKFDINNVLQWCTYYGGSTSTATNSQQNTYGVSAGAIPGDACGGGEVVAITGSTLYSDLPTPGGTHTLVSNTTSDIFIATFSAASGALNLGTLIGSDNTDVGYALAYDRGDDDLFVVGQATGNSFPYSNTTISGGGNFYDGSGKGVLIQFDCHLNVIWSTGYGSSSVVPSGVGGMATTQINDIRIDNNRNLLITGASPFAIPTSSPYLSSNNPSGSFYQGRTATNMYDPNGFIAKFTPLATGSRKFSLYYLTEFGGGGQSTGQRICPISNGEFYVSGGGSCGSFPITGTCPSTEDFMYIARFSASGAEEYCNMISGSQQYVVNGMVCSNENFLYLFASPISGNPGVNCVSEGGYYNDNSNASIIGNSKPLLIEMDPTNTITWATFFDGDAPGNSAGDVATDANHNLYVCGGTSSDQSSSTAFVNYPLVNNGIGSYYPTYQGNEDAYIAKFDISSSVTGIALVDNPDKNSIRYFPNPTSGILTIDLSNITSTLESLIVYDLMGEVVYTANPKDLSSKTMQIDMSGYSPGLYIISAKDSEGCISAKVVVSK